METCNYNLGRFHALVKLGMQLTFDNQQQAERHMRTRKTVGTVSGAAGGIAGGIAGSMAGTAVGGLPGSIAGGTIGGWAGEKVSLPATTMFDAGHDIRQRKRSRYTNTVGRLNTAANLPTNVPPGIR